MTTKFRIYDKEENEYMQEPDYRWMLSRNGKLYNSEEDKWREVGERYVVEFQTGVTCVKGDYIYEGDVSECYFYGVPYSEIDYVIFDEDQFKLKRNDIYLSCAESNKIIGTIHDEKYKGL